MVSIYITSPTGAEGKTTLSLGLGRKWQQVGKKVGYLKPVRVTPAGEAAPADADTTFVKKVLGLPEPADKLCPLSLTPADVAGIPSRSAPEAKLASAYREVGAGKDIVLLEGLSGQSQASARIARWLEAKAIIIAHYKANLVNELPEVAQAFGPALAGAVINAVPRGKMEQVASSLVPQLEGVGLRVLGVLPQERHLVGITVEELVQPLGAPRYIGAQDGLGEMVENIMGGAVFLDPGPVYFERKANKAVVIRLDRPDVQLGALETSMRCLILTNAQAEPNPYVYYKAMDLGVPLLLTPMDTAAALAAIEATLNSARFRQEKKLAPLEALLEKNLDFAALSKAVGI